MHRFLNIILLMILTAMPLAAQDDDDIPSPPKRHSPGAVKIGGAGGFTAGWLLYDLGPLNEFLMKNNSAPLSTSALPMLGGQGYGYILLLPNVRIGGVGSGGEVKSRSLTGQTRRDVNLSVGFGGMTVDYVLAIAPRFDIAFGATLGGGTMKLKLMRDDGSGKTWDGLLNEYGHAPTTQQFTRTVEGSFFSYQPSVNLEVAILRWLGVRAGVSYLGMSGGEWRLDEEFDVLGVPENIKAEGLMINTGIFIGTFIF